jgi:hypothetical protein
MGVDVGGVALTSSGGALSMDADTLWMAVNPSGILTRPQTPYRRGQFSGQGNPYNGNGGPLIFNADENFGGCWNNATGYWTCPVAGHYMVTGAAIAATQAGYFYINKNGSTSHYTHWNHTAAWHYVSLSDIVSCAAGDNISYSVGGLTPATTGLYAEGGHGMYSIALMA